MDHDSVPLDAPGPSSTHAADVRRAYETIAQRALEVMASSISTSPSYASNASGHFAWDISFAIRAACVMWRTTHDQRYLRWAAAWAQHLMDRTDHEIGLKDWRGCSGPVWSAGTRYTAGSTEIFSVDGARLCLQAQAKTAIISKPTPKTAVVTTVSANGSSWTSPEATLTPGEGNYLPDVLSQRSGAVSAMLRGLQKPTSLVDIAEGTYSLRAQNAAHLVHTGMIARALLMVADAIEGDGAPHLDIRAEEVRQSAAYALAEHDGELIGSGGRAWYVTSEDFPGKRLGMELPHNQVVDAATSLMILGRLRHDESMRMNGLAMARRFLDEVEEYRAGALPHPWHYYPVDSDVYRGLNRTHPIEERVVNPLKRGEDSSHAMLRIRAVIEWRDIDQDLVAEEELSTIATSFREHFAANDGRAPTLRWLPGDDLDAPRTGYANTYAGAWSHLTPWDPEAKDQLNSLAFHHPPREVFGATTLSAAEIFATT